MSERLKVEVILYCVYRIKEDDLSEKKDNQLREEFEIPFVELDQDYDYPLVAEQSGKIVLEENSDNKDMIDILYYKDINTKVPFHIGSVFRKSLVQYAKVFE